MQPLFEVLLKEIPAPQGDIDGPLQFMVTTLDYDDYVAKSPLVVLFAVA